MKKTLFIILLTLFGFSFLFPHAALAQAPTPTPQFIDPCPLNQSGANGGTGANFSILCSLSPTNALPALFTFVIVVGILIALVFLMWGGIKWVTSEGDKGKVDTARNQIIASLIGLILIFVAYFVINLLLNVFFGKNINQILNLPQINVSGSTTLLTGGGTCGTGQTCTCGTSSNNIACAGPGSTCLFNGTGQPLSCK